MPNFKAEGSLYIPLNTELEAMTEEEALEAFTNQLSSLAEDLNDLCLNHLESIGNIHFPQTCVEHIEKVQSTYTSLRSLQTKVQEQARTYTSLKDLYTKND